MNKLAEEVGCLQDDLELLVKCLRETNVEKLLMPVKYEHFDFPLLFWSPTDEPESEDAFLTDSPKNIIRQNKMKDYPSIIGSNVDEGMLITLREFLELFHYYLISPQLIKNPRKNKCFPS